MEYVKIEVDGQIKTMEVNRLLAQLVTLEGEENAQAEYDIPLVPHIEEVYKQTDGDFVVKFNVTFPSRPFSVNTRAQNSVRSTLLNRCFTNNQLFLKEEEGLRFKYKLGQQDTRFHTSKLFFEGVRVLPNIYNDKKLCFGRQEVTSRIGKQYILEDAHEAIIQFLGATFNTDLSDCSTGLESRRNLYLQLVEEYAHPRDKEPLTILISNFSNSELRNIYTGLTLASKLGISISQLQA